MDRQRIARQLERNPGLAELLRELLGGWRADVIDAMIAEPELERREALWAEQHYLERLSESIESELTSILSGRESDPDDRGREPES